MPASPSLPTRYTPSEHEPTIRERWEASSAFHARPSRVLNGEAPPYTILIPPPNVTARLHLGHALNNTLQDILIRAHRMMGYETLWMPGTDHAGIATQTIVDKRLKEAGEPALADYKRQEVEGGNGRDAFIEKVQEWKDEYEAAITDQLKQMGCSCDWSRQRFTMDEVCARAVREAFFELFRAGLIYRGKRLVNWDPVTQTALADDEVEMKDVDSFFWYMKYPLVDEAGAETGEHVTVATTRPETYLGDTAVAVNPDDPERKHLIGKRVKLPFVGRIIPIIGDKYVVMPDPEGSDAKAKYASGFLKVTPAHDPNDEMLGLAHAEEIAAACSAGVVAINVMAPDGSISDQHGWTDVGDAHQFVGLSREDARTAIEQAFRDANLLADKKPYTHAVGHSYRSHAPIEPYLSDQWYCKVSDERLVGFAQRALVKEQRTTDTWLPSTSRDLPTSRDRKGAGSLTSQASNTAPPPNRAATQTNKSTSYFITFSTYGTHLPGDEAGSVDRSHAKPDSPRLPPDPRRVEFNEERLEGDPVTLNAEQRAAVADAIREVCEHRGWQLHACNVRTTHVHIVVSSDAPPERAMNDFKSYATRRIRSASASASRDRQGADSPTRTWTRHGSTRYLNTESSFERAIGYVLHEQGEDLGGVIDGRAAAASTDAPRPAPSRSRLVDEETTDGAMAFHPARYAKTYESWHDNLRDWCISRQLWWGHRIPVWSATFEDPELASYVAYRLWLLHERVAARFESSKRDGLIDHDSKVPTTGFFAAEEMPVRISACVPNEGEEWVSTLEKALELSRDPDVLDTWFSSALWPLSTLGWPNHNLPLITAHQIDPDHAERIASVWVKHVGTWKALIGEADQESGELIDRLLHLRDKTPPAEGLAYQLFRAADLERDGTSATPLTKPDDITEADDLVCAVAIKTTGVADAGPYGQFHIRDLLLKHGFQDTLGLLAAFNPTNVLCTAREIITLWVSRMVMFNRYFLSPGGPARRAGSSSDQGHSGEPGSASRATEDPGPPPFADVFIHAMIQDGEGQKMSKSLGNGVDPLDLIDSHGADAMRFVLCHMTTQTQDVRMPVDLICPHCAEVFTPKMVTDEGGRRVAAPIQQCPKNPSHKMVSSYGVASGKATPTTDMPLARNTSSKFDMGRNFVTKFWNAARFTMMVLDESSSTSRDRQGADSLAAQAPPSHPSTDGAASGPLPDGRGSSGLALVDRWMLSRLARTVRDIDGTLKSYQFSNYAQSLYDILWRDFCDWYLEAVKPTVKESPSQQGVLFHTLDAIIRLMHPVLPYVTEAVWAALHDRQAPAAPDGLELNPSRTADAPLLCTAGWPLIDDTLIDEQAEASFEQLRELTDAMRQVRAKQNVPPRRKVTLHAPPEWAERIAQGGGVVETLAGLAAVSSEQGGGDAVRFIVDGAELSLSDLADAVDPSVERAALEEKLEALDRDIAQLDKRLSNPGYTDKAPAHLVQQTRDQMDQKVAERDAAQQRMKELS